MKYVLLFCLCSPCIHAQVLSVSCYNQNQRITATVNNRIANGSFENTNCPPWDDVTAHSFCPASSYYSCTLQDWSCNCGSASYPLIFNSSRVVIADGNLALYFGNSTAKACSAAANDTSCLNISSCEVTGVPAGYPFNSNAGYNGDTGIVIQQTVNGLTQDSIYILEFWAGGENGYFNRGLFAFDVGFGNILLRDRPTPVSGAGTRFVIQFKATSASHTIRFINWGHICGTCTELVLDDVRLYNITEYTGINEHLHASASVYPNPFTEEITVETNSDQEAEIIFHDASGRKILTKIFFKRTFINITLPGFYIYELKTAKGAVKGRLVKP